jgi:hypothetical protein
MACVWFDILLLHYGHIIAPRNFYQQKSKIIYKQIIGYRKSAFVSQIRPQMETHQNEVQLKFSN